MRSPRARPVGVAVSIALALCLLATSCGGSTVTAGKSPLPSDAKSGPPKRGGKVVYGVEAETAGGWCLPDAQLVISGIQIARSVYDTLTIPNADGGYSPYLAKTVTHDGAYTHWTITLRPGVLFHDGTALTAQVVKNNLDAYRGLNPHHNALLFRFVFSNVSDVSVTGPLSLVVTTKKPWVAFPAFLFGYGRVGIMAQAQLDASPADCATKLIGTGPFELKSWTPNDSLVVTRNPSYWFIAPDHKPYPYLDEIDYRVLTQSSDRLNGLQQGDLTAAHINDPIAIQQLEGLRDRGTLRMIESNRYAEVQHLLINARKPPFDDIRVRQALALGIDRHAINAQVQNNGDELATGPFGPGSIGNLADSGFPTKADPATAKKLLNAYSDEKLGGRPIAITLTSTPDAELLQADNMIKSELAPLGIDVTVRGVDQSRIVDLAIGGDFQVMSFRNHPGGDPDTQYVWWYGEGNPVNFGGFNDPEINRLLDAGRSEPDPAKRAKLYEDVNRRFATQVWDVWLWYTNWAVGTAPDVHGLEGPTLADGSKPFPGLANGHPVTGMWVG